MKQKVNNINDLEELYTPQQVAAYLRVSLRTVKRMLQRNEIRHTRSGIHCWVPISALQEWLQLENTDAHKKGKQ